MKKSKEFRPPFYFEDRRILVRDKIWYVPEHFYDWDSFTFPGWTSPEFFEKEQPIHLEYCSGNGTWIADKAEKFPQYNWVAVEKRYDRVAKIWAKIHTKKLKNLICIFGEGFQTTKHYVPTASVSQIYINFPDPWPKRCHHKHRLMQAPFVDEMCRILTPEGELLLVTDDPTYSTLSTALLRAHPKLASLHEEVPYLEELPGYGTSYFDDLWRKKGKTIRYHRYKTK